MAVGSNNLGKDGMTDRDELQRVLAHLQSTQALLHRARDRAVHLRSDTSTVLEEIETLLQELYLEANEMAAEGGTEASNSHPSRGDYDLDSLLGLTGEDGRDVPKET